MHINDKLAILIIIIIQKTLNKCLNEIKNNNYIKILFIL